MPSTQAESGELAKMRPEGLRLKTLEQGPEEAIAGTYDVTRFYRCHVLTMSVALLQLVSQP